MLGGAPSNTKQRLVVLKIRYFSVLTSLYPRRAKNFCPAWEKVASFVVVVVLSLSYISTDIIYLGIVQETTFDLLSLCVYTECDLHCLLVVLGFEL